MPDMLMGVPFDYEPKRENRFFLYFPQELGIDVWKVRSFTRPKLKINPVEIPFMNTSSWVQGRYIFESQEIVLIDPIAPSTTQAVMEWIRLGVEAITGRMGYAAGSSKSFILSAVDPTGIEVEKWSIEQAIVTNVTFGENKYDSDALQMITITIQPYKCINLF
jgi:hypothetical protein